MHTQAFWNLNVGQKAARDWHNDRLYGYDSVNVCITFMWWVRWKDTLERQKLYQLDTQNVHEEIHDRSFYATPRTFAVFRIRSV